MSIIVKENVIAESKALKEATGSSTQDLPISKGSERKRSSILDRCKPSTTKTKVDPNKLALVVTPKNINFAAFPINEELVVIAIKVTKGRYTSEEFYLATDNLHDELAGESALQSISIYMIQLETGEISFTYCKNGPLYGEPCSWFESKRVCLDDSMSQWLSIDSNLEADIYESVVAAEQPDLPTEGPDFYEALELLFTDKVIDTINHPILVEHNIGQPKSPTKHSTSRRIRRSSSTNDGAFNE